MPDHLVSALAQRLARIVELSAVALPALAPAACGGNVVVDGVGVGGSSSSASATSSAGGPTAACIVGPDCESVGPGPGPQQTHCFTPSPGQVCPDAAQAKPLLLQGCTAISSVDAACEGGQVGMCCYNVTAMCTCLGRPYLVGGMPQTAAAVRGDDRGWHSDEATDPLDLPRETRDALAAAFTADALGELASVVSFGRFARGGWVVGAPAELVVAAHPAALDEVRHAQIACGLASAFGGVPLGPGGFPLAPAVPSDLASLARATAVEGCVHETLAALVAAARAQAATDLRVAGVLGSIAEDEARHAELAWRTITWVLSVGGNEVAEAFLAALAGAVRAALTAPCAPPSAIDLRAFGVLGADAVGALVAAGVAGIVEPCVRSLYRAGTAARPAVTTTA